MLRAIALGLGLLFGGAVAVQASGDLSKQTPVKVTVQLGDERNALKFYPDNVELETGKLHQLVLVNAST